MAYDAKILTKVVQESVVCAAGPILTIKPTWQSLDQSSRVRRSEIGIRHNIAGRYLSAYGEYSTPEKFAEDFKNQIDEAHLILSLGSYRWVQFFGEYFGVNSALIESIRSGKPFIFQSVRAWERFFSAPHNANSSYVAGLFNIEGARRASRDFLAEFFVAPHATANWISASFSSDPSLCCWQLKG